MTILSLAAVLAEPARRSPGRTAVVQDGERFAYGQLWSDVLRHAGALAASGVRPGTRVALMAPNVVDFVRGYYGILAAGGVVVPIPTLLTADEIAYLLGHSGAELLLYHNAFAEAALAAAGRSGIDARDLATVADNAEPLRSYVSRQAEDPAVIFYTSGTTGRPKGAVLAHLNLVLNATVNAFDTNQIRCDDVIMGCLPLFHTFGQSVSMNGSFRAGAALVLQPRFNPDRAIEIMLAERTTLFLGVPTMYVQLLEAAGRVGDVELPKPRYCVSGGAALPVTVLERFEKAFDTTVYEGYGLSETSPTASVNQSWYGTKAGTVGHPIWGVDVEIAAEHVEQRIELLPPGELGEIVVRGHNVFQGYLDDPTATAQILIDGWFRTGDIGKRDDQGFIHIVDRKKDLIIRSGFNVYPREVEEVLLRHPNVAQVAVVGLRDDERGEEICAVVIPHDSATFDPAELIGWSKDRLGRHKYPRRVEVVSELPLGPSHKVLKRELRTKFGPK